MAAEQNKKKVKVGMISLGCAKNQVDGEMLMASLEENGFELSDAGHLRYRYCQYLRVY